MPRVSWLAGRKISAGHDRRDQDRQPAQAGHGVVVQVALARYVHHAEPAGEAGGGRRCREGDHGRDEERPEGIELVHSAQGTRAGTREAEAGRPYTARPRRAASCG